MSNVIRIISKKILKPDFSRVSFIEYTNELSECAKTQKGFIKSNSYWKTPLKNNSNNLLGNPHELIVISISDWNDIEYWNKWYNSDTRNSIHSKYKGILQSENFSLLNKKLVNDDVFLL